MARKVEIKKTDLPADTSIDAHRVIGHASFMHSSGVLRVEPLVFKHRRVALAISVRARHIRNDLTITSYRTGR